MSVAFAGYFLNLNLNVQHMATAAVFFKHALKLIDRCLCSDVDVGCFTALYNCAFSSGLFSMPSPPSQPFMLILEFSLFLAHFSLSHCLQLQNVGFTPSFLHLHRVFLLVSRNKIAGLLVFFSFSLPFLPTRTQTIVPSKCCCSCFVRNGGKDSRHSLSVLEPSLPQ